jgi:hypothetical protein
MALTEDSTDQLERRMDARFDRIDREIRSGLNDTLVEVRDELRRIRTDLWSGLLYTILFVSLLAMVAVMIAAIASG